MELACQALHGHFGPVYLLQVSKNEDENVASWNDLDLNQSEAYFIFLPKFKFKSVEEKNTYLQ